jgi:hypothetical protein
MCDDAMCDDAARGISVALGFLCCPTLRFDFEIVQVKQRTAG